VAIRQIERVSIDTMRDVSIQRCEENVGLAGSACKFSGGAAGYNRFGLKK